VSLDSDTFWGELAATGAVIQSRASGGTSSDGSAGAPGDPDAAWRTGTRMLKLVRFAYTYESMLAIMMIALFICAAVGVYAMGRYATQGV
jgi:hypothetical protein